ncbi:unnamed protein product, partial [Bubo scandiacus]
DDFQPDEFPSLTLKEHWDKQLRPQWIWHLKETQLEAGLHTHLRIPALPKSKSGCTCIYQIAGTKKKSSFLLPIFLAFNLLCLLLAE